MALDVRQTGDTTTTTQSHSLNRGTVSQLAAVSRVLVQEAIAMKEATLAAVAILLNVTVCFATDGQWKTAGLSLMTVYWRLNRVRSQACCAA